MYSASDILWIKNVLRNQGSGWAYEDKTFSDPSILNWSNQFKGSALTAGIGEMIVLFQTPKKIGGTNNKTVFLTHLVSPMDEFLYEDLQYPDHRWGRKVILLARPNSLDKIPNPGFFNF